MASKDIALKPGQKFGDLTYVREAKPTRWDSGNRFCIWRCSCGRLRRTRVDAVVLGRSRSCGCKSQRAMRRQMSALIAELQAKARPRKAVQS